jgi:hypothetical protein
LLFKIIEKAMKQIIILSTMKKENIARLANEEKAQVTVLFSVLLLLIVIVGLTALQIGQGVVSRIRFRQLADSSCLSAAATYPAQAVALEHTVLTHEYVLLAAQMGTSFCILNEAAQIMNSKVPGHDTLSVYLGSADFTNASTAYADLMDSISSTPQDPNLLPSGIETEARTLLHLSSVQAARRNCQDNQNIYGGIFQDLEQVVLPDSFLWSDTPLEQPVQGFFQISDMPAPRFFFLTAFPYSSIDRKGKMINASYTSLIDYTALPDPNPELAKDKFDQQNQSLDTLNQTNTTRLNSMKLIALPMDAAKRANLISFWEAMVDDYQQWAQTTVDLDLFGPAFSSASYTIPSFTTILNAQYELREAIEDIAESKGISTFHHNTMKEELSESLGLRDFFSSASTELAVIAFQDRLNSYYEALLENTSVTQASINLLLQQLEPFDEDTSNPNQDIPSILRSISESLESQLDAASKDKIQPMEFFLEIFSSNIQDLFDHVNSISLNWNAMNSLTGLDLPTPSNTFYNDAPDFFAIPITRLESN